MTKIQILEDGTPVKVEPKNKCVSKTGKIYYKYNKNYYKSLSEEQKEKNKKLNTKRLSKEQSYMKSRYDSIAHRHKSKKSSPKYYSSVYKCFFTWEEFWNAWEKHKEIYGGKFCAISGKEMTHIGSNPPGVKKFSRNWANISPDKLDPEKPYTLQNLIFVRWDINKQKNDFPIKYIKKILELYNNRFIDLKPLN
jgi:ATP-dependent 26S proteasome regulatory subunit